MPPPWQIRSCFIQFGRQGKRRHKFFLLMIGLVTMICLQMVGIVSKVTPFLMTLLSSPERRTFNNVTVSIPEITTRTIVPTNRNGSDTACSYVSVNPFDPEILKYVPKRRPLDCSRGKPSVVYLDGDYLRVNVSKLNRTLGQRDVFCRYARLELSEYNDSYLKRLKWSKRFSEQPMKISQKDEHLHVKCIRYNNVVSETFKSRVIEKPEMEKIRDADYSRHVQKNSPSETMSVLVVGIDSMSKQNLERTMPKTKDYILEHFDAKELNMFNKVGDNTFPNVIPLLSGLRHTDLGQHNWTEDDYFDVIDDLFLWRDYQKAGYRTSFTVDVTDIAAFHYLKKGWRHPTFDFYSRPISLKMRTYFYLRKRRRRSFGSNCIGDVPQVEILQDYILQLLKKYNTKTRPYFFYNFFTQLTHDYQLNAAKGDDMYLGFFQQLKRSNVLNNTVVMFFSDHGNRFGPARHTFNGKVETNTPFVFFMFPPWFEQKYPEAMAAFRRNQDRLTTFFDLHRTLKDLLTFSGRTRTARLRSRAISLFDDIPTARTCQHADIPLEFCNCKEFSNATVPQKVSKIISNHLLHHLVNITSTSAFRRRCAVLSLQSVKSILTIKSDTAGTMYYQIIIETAPGGGVYEGLVKYDTATGAVETTGKVIRLNFYKGQDQCVGRVDLKPYCFCK